MLEFVMEIFNDVDILGWIMILFNFTLLLYVIYITFEYRNKRWRNGYFEGWKACEEEMKPKPKLIKKVTKKRTTKKKVAKKDSNK